jgi:hypothetical protein
LAKTAEIGTVIMPRPNSLIPGVLAVALLASPAAAEMRRLVDTSGAYSVVLPGSTQDQAQAARDVPGSHMRHLYVGRDGDRTFGFAIMDFDRAPWVSYHLAFDVGALARATNGRIMGRRPVKFMSDDGRSLPGIEFAIINNNRYMEGIYVIDGYREYGLFEGISIPQSNLLNFPTWIRTFHINHHSSTATSGANAQAAAGKYSAQSTARIVPRHSTGANGTTSATNQNSSNRQSDPATMHNRTLVKHKTGKASPVTEKKSDQQQKSNSNSDQTILRNVDK